MSIEEVDSAIAQLLSVQSSAPGIEVNLPEDLIIKIVRKGRDVFMQQPILLELNAPINIWYVIKFTTSYHVHLLSLFQR